MKGIGGKRLGNTHGGTEAMLDTGLWSLDGRSSSSIQHLETSISPYVSSLVYPESKVL